MSGASLTLERVAKRWPDGTDALVDVTLAVPGGGALAILGSSGAGKSTLLRLVAGLEALDGGTIRLGERVLAGDGVHVPPEQRGVGMVFQALELWPHLTVAEHMAFGLPGRPRGRAAANHETVRGLASDVGLPDHILRRRPETLSGGEQQRVAIARTLAAKPGVILYDEPLANLDPARRATLRALIRRLARQHGTTVVYVTHDPQEALELGDAVAVFSDGRLVEYGTPVDLYRTPESLLGARALGPVTALPGTVAGGRAETLLGAHETTAKDGACTVLWRPEGVAADAASPLKARLLDVFSRGGDYQFHALLGDDEHEIHGVSAQPLDGLAEVGIRAATPNSVLAGAMDEERA